jgi:hypothetical protein
MCCLYDGIFKVETPAPPMILDSLRRTKEFIEKTPESDPDKSASLEAITKLYKKAHQGVPSPWRVLRGL